MRDSSRRRYIFNLILVVALLFAFSACGRGQDDAAETPADVDSVAAPASAQPDAEPTANPAPTDVPADEAEDDATTRSPAPAVVDSDLDIADLSELDSYRARSVMTPVQDEAEGGMAAFMSMATVMETEYVREPAASRTLILDDEGNVTTEMVSVDGQTWINVAGMGWMTSGPDETDMADGITPEVEALIRQIARDMDRVGQETVNDVRTVHYTVDSQFEVPFPAPTAEELAQAEEEGFPAPTAVRGTVVGDIWIAAERNLPPVIVRSVTTQQISFVFDEKPEMDEMMPPGMGFLFGEGSMTINEERDVTDINQPITIQAPEGALDMGGMMPTPPEGVTAPPAEDDASAPLESPEFGTGETVDVASLDSLDSYQAELITTITTGDMDVASTITEAWVADPPARRVVADMGGMEMEYVVVEAEAWMKIGGMWMPGDAAEADDLRGDLDLYTGSVDNMVFVGAETVNGVNTRFYRKTETFSGQTMVTEIWVADEADLPAVVVRARFSAEMPSMVNTNEVNVTLINQPITIEPPE
jgi:hypothetical protein